MENQKANKSILKNNLRTEDSIQLSVYVSQEISIQIL